MKLTQYDTLAPVRLGAGYGSMSSADGSNSDFGGDVTGSPGELTVVGLRSKVSLSSNINPTNLAGDVLTLIAPGVAQFATASNGAVSSGSNATRVRANSTGGVGAAYSLSDHAHDGIATITASSSNTLGRGTFNLRAGNGVSIGWTDTDGDGLLDTATVHSTGGGGGGSSSSGSLLAVVAYYPGSENTYTVTSTTLGDIDATNVAITFTAPASGNVVVHAEMLCGGTMNGADPSWNMGLRESSSQVGSLTMIANGSSTAIARRACSFYLTGISAGSHTYKLASKLASAGGTGTIYYGGTSRGPILLTVTAAP